MMMVQRHHLLLLLVATLQSVVALELGQQCVNPKGEPGKCILFRECGPLLKIYNKPVNTLDDTHFLTQSRCGVLQRKTLVCCTMNVTNVPQSLPEPPYCGIQLEEKVYGGQVTQLDEFPWMALIEYQKPDGTFDYHCGGSLINDRYIVTAAHCIKSIPKTWKPYRVRLGEWDLTTARDCVDEYCVEAPIDLDIEKIVVHKDYDTRDMSNANDIALIRFHRPVHYSSTIRPICLPITDAVRTRNHLGLPSYAAGWGKTETSSQSEKKLKVELNIKSTPECKRLYERGGIIIKPVHLCAGGVRGKDTCSGDSGGPLMRQLSGIWYLLGIVSFGPQKCGTAGVPGVYTNVTQYTDWIRNNIY